MPRFIYSDGSPVPVQSQSFLGTVAYEEDRTKTIDIDRNLQIPEFKCTLKVEVSGDDLQPAVMAQEQFLALIRNAYVTFNGRKHRMKINGRGLWAEEWRNEFRGPVISGLNGGPTTLPNATGGYEMSFTMTAQVPSILEGRNFYLDTRQEKTGEIYQTKLHVDWGNKSHVYMSGKEHRNITSVSLDIDIIESVGDGLTQHVQDQNGNYLYLTNNGQVTSQNTGVPYLRKIRAHQFEWRHIEHEVTSASDQLIEIPRVEKSQLVEAIIVATCEEQSWKFYGAWNGDKIKVNHGSDYVWNQPKIDTLRDYANKERGNITMPENLILYPFYPTTTVAANQVARSLQYTLPDEALSEELDMTIPVRVPANGKTFADNAHKFDIYLQYATVGNLD